LRVRCAFGAFPIRRILAINGRAMTGLAEVSSGQAHQAVNSIAKICVLARAWRPPLNRRRLPAPRDPPCPACRTAGKPGGGNPRQLGLSRHSVQFDSK